MFKSVFERRHYAVLSAILFLGTLSAYAVPDELSHQGRLLDASGTPLTGTYQVSFAVFDDSTGGTALWSETHSVAVDNGDFHVELGSVTSFPANLWDTREENNRYLEITVESDPPLSPRTPILSAPYAISSSSLNGDVLTDPGALYVTDSSTGDTTITLEGEPVKGINLVLEQQPGGLTTNTQITGKGLNVTSLGSGRDDAFSFGVEEEGLKMIITDSLGDTTITLEGEPVKGINLVLEQQPGGLTTNTQITGKGLNVTSLGSGRDDAFSFGVEEEGVKMVITDSLGDTTITLNGGNDGGELFLRTPTPGGAADPPGEFSVSDIDDDGHPDIIVEGSLTIGSGSPSTILTVEQNSATDPVADAWDVYSSRRWKENIRRIQSSLEIVRQLRGVRFDWKADGRSDIGVIAEEVGEVVPELVDYEENGVDARSVDYARLTPLLIEAVKAQQQTIERQASRLNKLEQTVAELNEIRGELADAKQTLSRLAEATAISDPEYSLK